MRTLTVILLFLVSINISFAQDFSMEFKDFLSQEMDDDRLDDFYISISRRDNSAALRYQLMRFREHRLKNSSFINNLTGTVASQWGLSQNDCQKNLELKKLRNNIILFGKNLSNGFVLSSKCSAAEIVIKMSYSDKDYNLILDPIVEDSFILNSVTVNFSISD